LQVNIPGAPFGSAASLSRAKTLFKEAWFAPISIARLSRTAPALKKNGHITRNTLR
jgi:hypothetical protein